MGKGVYFVWGGAEVYIVTRKYINFFLIRNKGGGGWWNGQSCLHVTWFNVMMMI